MKYLILFVVVTRLSLSQSDMNKEKELLKQVDIDFSGLSGEKGMKEAFLSYIDDSGVLLRPNIMPVVGLDNVKKFLEQGNTDFVLTWLPLFADVSQSLDLGYTYGTYELTYKDDTGNLKTRQGTYVNIWKKNSEGKWKFVLDTGNPGLGD